MIKLILKCKSTTSNIKQKFPKLINDETMLIKLSHKEGAVKILSPSPYQSQSSKNEVFYRGFLPYMWPNLQETPIWLHLLKKWKTPFFAHWMWHLMQRLINENTYIEHGSFIHNKIQEQSFIISKAV